MRPTYFPDPISAWVFFSVLMGLLAVASYKDWRDLVVPKWLTLPALALGVLANLLRGGWLAWHEAPGWTLQTGGRVWVGAADGLLFALAGFAVGFLLFFALWLVGTCGGGDVKLFAALGAWIGPGLAIGVLVGTLLVVIALSILRLVFALLYSGFGATVRAYSLKERNRARDGERFRPRKRLLSYSLPLAISTAAVLLWVLRADLQLTHAERPGNERTHAHAR